MYTILLSLHNITRWLVCAGYAASGWHGMVGAG